MKNEKRFNLWHSITKTFYRFRQLSFVKHILMFYIIITFLGTGLLMTSFAHRDGVHVSFSDALFTAASAFSDTGLSSLTTAETWSIGGQAIIAMLIMVGGMGWFALKVYLVNVIFGRPISFASRDALAGERGSDKVGFSKNIIKVSITILLIVLLIASIALTLFFYYSSPDLNPFNVTGTQVDSLTGKHMVFEDPHHDILKSIRFGVFHSVSALNNAGFDIIGSNSVAPYYHQYGIQAIFIVLFMIGGMGYPVIYDVWNWFKAKIKGQKHHWSLFTKLSVSVYFLVSAIGLAATFAIEVPAHDYHVDGSGSKVNTFWNNPMYGTDTDKGMALFFNSLSTRNAGFSTIRMGDLAPTTVLFFSVLMFIGSAPSSTAGGIRTTTFGIILVGLWGKIRGRDQVRLFNRRVSNDTVIRSYIVLAASLIIVIVATLIAYTSFGHSGGQINTDINHMFLMRVSDSSVEKYIATPYTFNELIFETTSAFGTTGLSAGLTSSLSLAAKITLILTMFIGQLGVSSTILIWRSRKAKARHYNFVEEDVTIG